VTVIAVTGVAGTLAQRFMARLEADLRVSRVVGIDPRHPPSGSPKLEHHELDIRDARLAKLLVGADAVVHLAFAHEAMRDEDEMRSVNIDGTANVVEAAISAGVGHLIFLSSATVYGAHADNDVPLTEASPLRPNDDFPPAMHKHRAEQLVASFTERAPGAAATILRAATVFGPTAENFLSRMLEAPRLTTVKGFEPPWQVVHEEDVASALAFAAARRLSGVYNLAADGWLSGDEVQQISGKRRVELAEPVAFAMADRLWKAGLTASPPGELHYVMHPWVLDNAKLRAAGWEPRYTNRAALLESLEAHRNWIALGRARVRKDSLALGAAATLGAVGAMAILRRRKR